MKKRHGHFCWMCGRNRPNEAFSGKGHRRHLCKKCSQRPKAERERIHAEMELTSFLYQKNISEKNIVRLEALCKSEDDGIRQLATLVLNVAKVAPRKRKRAGFLRHHHPDLYEQLVQYGFYPEWIEASEPTEDDLMFESDDGPHYFNDDGTEFFPGLYPAPDLCVSCKSNAGDDAEENVLCNLTRADQQEDEVFLCFAYQPISPEIDREAVLRELCREAGTDYPETDLDADATPEDIPF